MKNLLQFKRKHLVKITFVFLIGSIVFGAACDSKLTDNGNAPAGLIVVKSPADGFITKVLVNEGASVGKDAGIVEIETEGEMQNAPIDEKTDKSGGVNLQTTEVEVKNAEERVERASVEVERVQSLVAANSVPQAQLDAARADFQRAQEFLQNVREKKKNQETALLVKKSRGETVKSEKPADEKIVTARVSVGGILKVLNARVGQRVKTGQPLATVSIE